MITEKKEVRFLMVGILNTVFGYGIYAILCYFGYSLTIAITISTILGTFHSYLWNKLYTFKSKKKSVAELIRFILVYFIAYLINIKTAALLLQYFKMDKYIIGVLTIFISTLISYIGHNKFSFKNNH